MKKKWGVCDIQCQVRGCGDTFACDIERHKHNLRLMQLCQSGLPKIRAKPAKATIYSLLMQKTGKKRRYCYLKTTAGKIAFKTIYLCPRHVKLAKDLKEVAKLCLNVCELEEETAFFVKPFAMDPKTVKSIRKRLRAIRNVYALVEHDPDLKMWRRELEVMTSLVVSKFIMLELR